VALYTNKQANIMQRFHVQFIPKISLMDKIHVTVHVHVNIDFFFVLFILKKTFLSFDSPGVMALAWLD
jgi:hypothetical protein